MPGYWHWRQPGQFWRVSPDIVLDCGSRSSGKSISNLSSIASRAHLVVIKAASSTVIYFQKTQNTKCNIVDFRSFLEHSLYIWDMKVFFFWNGAAHIKVMYMAFLVLLLCIHRRIQITGHIGWPYEWANEKWYKFDSTSNGKPIVQPPATPVE
jgi:hypothetical protein